METILVLSGLTTREEAERPSIPGRAVIDSIADLLPEVEG